MRAREWQQIPWMLGCVVALLWGIECVNALFEHRLNRWGILPRTFAGLVGIPLAMWSTRLLRTQLHGVETVVHLSS